MDNESSDIVQPSMANLIFTGLFGILIGLIVGCINMTTIKIKEVKELPPAEEMELKAVYFVKGDERGGKEYILAQKQFEASRPGNLNLVEGQLNQWARKAFKVSSRSGDDDGNKIFGLAIEFGQPNFNMENDSLQIASYLSFPQLAAGKKFLFQARGGFAQTDGIWEFRPEKAYIGSCPIPNIGGLPNIVENLLLNSYLENKDMGNMERSWLKIKSIQFNSGFLIVSI